jgi:SAM-dependent methyltransferase
MTAPAAQPSRAKPTPTADHEAKDARACVEQEWRSRLLADPSETAFREAYDALHAAMRDSSERARLYETALTCLDRAFLRRLPPARRVLDIGAGNGRFARAAAGAHWVVALEISAEAIAVLQDGIGESGRPTICQASGLRLPFAAASFDTIVSQDLIEHLHPGQLAPHLAEVHRVLAPGGRYFLHTPSSLHGSTSLGLHLREYRLRELRRTAQACGFRPRWLCVNLARVGWTGTAPTALWPLIEAWEACWGALGALGLRRLAGRCYAAAIPDVDVVLVKAERGCGSSI